MKVKKKVAIVFWFILLTPILLCSMEYFFGEGGLKRIYYIETYDKDKVRVVDDDDFIFYEEGYARTYKLNSTYCLSHRILLIPDSILVPVQYEFNGEILIEIFDNHNEPLYSFKVIKPINLLREGKDDYYGNYLVYNGKQSSRSTSVFAFELGDVPYKLIGFRRNRLKDMEIKVTVLRPDQNLREFCESAELVIIPDLRL